MPLLTGRYWEMVERLKLDHIYLAPTSLRLLLKAGDSWVKKYDLSSLRKLGYGERQTYMHTHFCLLVLNHGSKGMTFLLWGN